MPDASPPEVSIVIDGRPVAVAEARISVLDRGLLLGDGVFEVLRTWGGRPIELDAHLGRLAAAAESLRLAPPPRAALAEAVDRAVAGAPPGHHRVRVVLTRGPGPVHARLGALGPGRAIVIAEPLRPPPGSVALALVDWPLPRRRGGGLKTLSYLDHLRARELAAEAGADEALRLDADGHVAEGATSSVFVVAGGRVRTPPVEGGVLPGVTRARLLALCAALGLDAREEQIPLATLRGAEELFVASAARGVVPAHALDGVARAPGPISARLRAAHDAYLAQHGAQTVGAPGA